MQKLDGLELANSVQGISIVHRNLRKLTTIKMFIVGVTGGIATGKSAVCEIFKEYGIPVIDADVAARKGLYVGLIGLPHQGVEHSMV